MDKLLKALYDAFYEPLALTELNREVDDCHRQLIERLEKPERRLVLRIIDAQNHISSVQSVDSFISGFQLAWRLANELNHREITRPILAEQSVGTDAISISEKACGAESAL